MQTCADKTATILEIINQKIQCMTIQRVLSVLSSTTHQHQYLQQQTLSKSSSQGKSARHGLFRSVARLPTAWPRFAALPRAPCGARGVGSCTPLASKHHGPGDFPGQHELGTAGAQSIAKLATITALSLWFMLEICRNIYRPWGFIMWLLEPPGRKKISNRF